MNSIAQPPTSRGFSWQVANELSEIWQQVIAASPRDQIEFGAKAFGFSGDAGNSADVPLWQASSLPNVVSSEPGPDSIAPASVDIIHVNRGSKADWTTIQLRKGQPPEGSIEWSDLSQKRIGYLSAALALATMWAWLLAILRGGPHPNSDWGPGLVAILLMLPALYALFFFLIDWVFGRTSGSTAMARKYMDQVYPPQKKREN